MNQGKLKTIIHNSLFMIPSHRGFTLIELLIVIAVLGILSVGVLIALNVTGNLNKASLAKVKTFSASIENDLSINQVGKWSFEEGGGTIAKDTSGYGNDGTLTGVFVWQNADQCSLGFGGCIKFDGTNGKMSAGALGIPQNGTATLAGWFYFMNSAKNRGIHMTLYENFLYQESVNDNLKICCTNDYFPVASLLTLNKWHHIVFTYSGNTTSAKLYLDTKLFTATVQPGIDDIPVFPGTISSSTPNEAFEGLIDEVAIYKEALTLSQIQQLYAQGLPRHQLAKK